MLRHLLLSGFCIVCFTKGSRPQILRVAEDFSSIDEIGEAKLFSKSKGRLPRAVFDCRNVTRNHHVQVTYGENVVISCTCKGQGSLKWYDSANCKEISSSDRINISGDSITIVSFNRSDPQTYVCADDAPHKCSESISVTAIEKTPTSGNGGAGAVIVIIVIVLFFIVSLYCLRRHKSKVGLCFRDTFKANDGKDGKEFDAYVSTGYTEIDRKFVESLVFDVLQKKCHYKLLADNKNILPKLEYSPKLRSNINRCRRLVVVFSPSYMTHDWCMYCFNEGLRKIVELHIPTIFVITDHTMRAELYSHNDVISHIPQVLLTQYQPPADRQRAIEQIRQNLPPPMKSSVKFSSNKKNGMRSPIMGDAESIHRSELALNGDGAALQMEDGTEYTFGVPPQQISDEIEREYDEALEEPEPDDFVTAIREGDDIDPDKVRVNQYNARKDFYSIAMTDTED